MSYIGNKTLFLYKGVYNLWAQGVFTTNNSEGNMPLMKFEIESIFLLLKLLWGALDIYKTDFFE